MKAILLSLCLLAFCSLVKAQETDEDTAKTTKKFEISFGQSLLFISYTQSLNILNNAAIVVPTNSILLFAVLRPLKRFHIPFFCNIPTESKQYLVNGILVNERANPTIGTGLEAKIFHLPITKDAKIELNFAALGSSILTKTHKFVFAPLLASRVRIIQNNNFVMYLGSSYSFGIKSLGLIYGTGYIF